MSNSLNINTKVSLKEFSTLISTVGKDVTILGQGEPGIGKSAVFHTLKTTPQYADHEALYLDASLLDVGDLQIPVVDNATQKYAFTPNAMFVNDRPMLIMIDELGKAQRAVQNAILPLLNGEKRIGNFKLHRDTTVFATTNLSTDGVGDTIQAHAVSRMCRVQVGKPTADEMVEYGVKNNWDASLLAWIMQYPHCMESYTDDPKSENPYIFNPRKQQMAYFCPRSAEKASHISKQRHNLTPQAFIAALTGTVGESAARDMQAFFAMGDKLPSWDRVIQYPDTCPVPDDKIAQTILALGAVARTTKDNINAWLEYMLRLEAEVQALFCTQMMTTKSSLLVTNRRFVDWAVKMSFVF